MTNLDVNKLSENLDYELIPVDNPNEQAWHVRILRGDFLETVLCYGNVGVKKDHLTFNFDVITTPYEGLTSESVELQNTAADILEDILANAFANNEAVLKDQQGNIVDY